MDDRTLLEMAAKATGIAIDPIDAMHDPDEWHAWNPLEDDGDALRLRNAMQMTIIDEGDRVFVEINRYPVGGAVREPYERDMPGGFASQSSIHAAVRRAIVRAAAEIGKEMP